MDQVATEPKGGLMERHPWVTQRPITVAEYHRMGEVGILSQDKRHDVELIEGRLIPMAPVGSEHFGTTLVLGHQLMVAVGDRALVSVSGPIRLDDLSEPEPDFALLRPRADFYRGEIPRPPDILLVIEVSSSSLRYDRVVKRALYARHGIPEYWIVDLAAEEVEVCRDPRGEVYANVERLRRGATVEPLLIPGAGIAVVAILG